MMYSEHYAYDYSNLQKGISPNCIIHENVVQKCIWLQVAYLHFTTRALARISELGVQNYKFGVKWVSTVQFLFMPLHYKQNYIPQAHLKNPVIWLVQLSVVVFNHAR